MIRHGHVRPNPDGSRARCGGPGLCTECSKEVAELYQEEYDSYINHNFPGFAPVLNDSEKEQAKRYALMRVYIAGMINSRTVYERTTTPAIYS